MKYSKRQENGHRCQNKVMMLIIEPIPAFDEIKSDTDPNKLASLMMIKSNIFKLKMDATYPLVKGLD